MALNSGNWRCTFNFTLPNGTPAAVVRHVSTSLAPADTTVVEAIGDAILAWWDTNPGPGVAAKSLFSAQTNLDGLTFTQMVGAPQLQLDYSINIAGTDAGDAPPAESSVVTTWYTGFPGRAYRGRSFWPGYGDSSLSTTGVMSTADVNVWNQVMTDLRNAVDAASDVADSWGLYSRSLDEVMHITGNVVRSVFHHQSRRNQ